VERIGGHRYKKGEKITCFIWPIPFQTKKGRVEKRINWAIGKIQRKKKRDA